LADGPASQNRNSSAWRVRHRPCAHRRAVQRVLADRGRSGMPRRTRNSPATNRADRIGRPRRSLRPFRGEIRLSANGRSIGGRQDWISAAVGGTCRCEERRGSSAHPRGAVRHRRVKGQRKGRVLYTHPYLLDRLDRLLPSASRTCSRQRGGPSSSGGSRWPPRPIPGRTSGCGAISWRSSLRTVGRRAVASCQPDARRH
jgi:hypothetical protein